MGWLGTSNSARTYGEKARKACDMPIPRCAAAISLFSNIVGITKNRPHLPVHHPRMSTFVQPASFLCASDIEKRQRGEIYNADHSPSSLQYRTISHAYRQSGIHRTTAGSSLKWHALHTGPYMTGSYEMICVTILVSHSSLQPQRKFERSFDP